MTGVQTCALPIFFASDLQKAFVVQRESSLVVLYGIFPKEFYTLLMVMHVNDLTHIGFLLVEQTCGFATVRSFLSFE